MGSGDTPTGNVKRPKPDPNSGPKAGGGRKLDQPGGKPDPSAEERNKVKKKWSDVFKGFADSVGISLDLEGLEGAEQNPPSKENKPERQTQKKDAEQTTPPPKPKPRAKRRPPLPRDIIRSAREIERLKKTESKEKLGFFKQVLHSAFVGLMLKAMRNACKLSLKPEELVVKIFSQHTDYRQRDSLKGRQAHAHFERMVIIMKESSR